MSSRTRSSKIVSAVQPGDYEHTNRVLAGLGAVLAYLPFGWWIAAAYPTFSIIGGVIAVGVASFPDKLSGVGMPERWTHSMVGAVLVGCLLAAGGWWFASEVLLFAGGRSVTPLTAAEYMFVVGGLSACGHLVIDGFTGTDVHLLWPVSDRGGSIDLMPLVDIRNNDGFNFVGTIVVIASISSLLTVMGLGL